MNKIIAMKWYQSNKFLIVKTTKRAEMTWRSEENSEFVVWELVVEFDEHDNCYEMISK